MSNEIFTVDDNNNAAVRTVSVKAGAAETNKQDIFTVDENGNAAVRVMGGAGSLDESKIIVKSADIPVASADELNKFYCYDGETNATYTHGYIYECVAGDLYYEANIAFAPSTFASEDFYKAGKLIVDAGVANPEEVASVSMTYALAGNLWSIVFKDAEDNALNTAYSIYTEDLEQDYDILPVIDPSEFVDGQVVTGTVNNIVEHRDYSWQRMDVQPAAKVGRYLSGWNCATGLAMTNPPESLYEYTTGDYFIVGVVATGGASNYKPNGSSYVTGQASTTVETSAVNVNDMYLYDGTNWTLLKTGSAVTSVNGQVGDVTLGINDVAPTQTGKSGYVLGTDGFVAGWVKPEIVQRSALPQASEEEVDKIYQYIGTTDANYTNGYFYKCISDGQNPATYSWTQVDVQPAPEALPDQTGNSGKFLTTDGTDASWASVGGLPDQTGNAGKFLTTDGTDASWGTISALQNNSTNSGSLAILGRTVSSQNTDCVVIGESATAGAGSSTTTGAVVIGYGAKTNNWASNSIAIGKNAESDATGAIVIGNGAKTTVANFVLLGESSTAYGFRVGKYLILNSTTGLIIADRLGTGYDATKTQTLKNVQGVLTWVDD